MAFFDDLGKKLTQVGQSTIEKTKEMADIARINSYISDEEKNINNFYTEIGKLYVSLHSEDFAEDFATMINGIRESEAKIVGYKKELQVIKGVKKCPKCGAEVDKNSAFCSGCGEKMPEEAPEVAEEVAVEATTDANKKTCAGCGTEVATDAAFCPECGAKL